MISNCGFNYVTDLYNSVEEKEDQIYHLSEINYIFAVYPLHLGYLSAGSLNVNVYKTHDKVEIFRIFQHTPFSSRPKLKSNDVLWLV